MTHEQLPLSQYEITTELRPEEPHFAGEWWEANINGRTYHGLWGKTEADARAAAERAIARWEADDAIRAVAEDYYGRPDPANVDDLLEWPLAPGARVVIYSRGYKRRAVVEKVGRKNVACVYVTRPGGTLTRKAVARAEVCFEMAGHAGHPWFPVARQLGRPGPMEAGR
jgi:hypothetical protein